MPKRNTIESVLENTNEAIAYQESINLDNQNYSAMGSFLVNYQEKNYPKDWPNEYKCVILGCEKNSHFERRKTSKTDIYRTLCGYHHGMRNGLVSKNPKAKWKYRIHRKNYCENIDGRLGYKCTATIVDSEFQLDADHIDENHYNNKKENIQTLCKCCHAIKTKQTNGTGKHRKHF